MRHWSRYWPAPPVRGQIDILLSLRMTRTFWFMPPMLFSASKTMPRGRPVADDRDRLPLAISLQIVAEQYDESR